MDLQNFLRIVLAAKAEQDGKCSEKRCNVKVLATAEPHFIDVLVGLQRFRKFPFGEINCAQIEPRRGVAGVGGNHTLQRGFGVRIAQLAFE